MILPTKYEVAFASMPVGQSVVEFNFASSLFPPIEESGIEGGEGTIILDIIKHASMLEITATIKGELQVECDRCADLYTQSVEMTSNVIVKMSAEQGEYDGDIIWIEPRTKTVDLTQWLYEGIILSLPIQRVHTDRDNCNQDALKYLQSE